MTADTGPLTLEDLRRELRCERRNLGHELDQALSHLLSKADLQAFETRFTVRLIVAVTALGAVLAAVDRLWT